VIDQQRSTRMHNSSSRLMDSRMWTQRFIHKMLCAENLVQKTFNGATKSDDRWHSHCPFVVSDDMETTSYTDLDLSFLAMENFNTNVLSFLAHTNGNTVLASVLLIIQG